MAIVEGQIESLRKLKEELNRHNITGFNSIAEINSFKRDYGSKRNEIPKIIESKFVGEIKALQSDLAGCQRTYEDLKEYISNEINNDIKTLWDNFNQAKDKANKSLIIKLFSWLKIRRLENKKARLEKNFDKLVQNKTRNAEYKVSTTKNNLDKLTHNKKRIIAERCRQSYQEIDHVKEVVDGLYTLIAGAIGESAVAKELQKLPDNYILINDYSKKFNPPIYNRKKNDRIFSIQVDHLLICNAGIFILETKNWSKQSIQSLDLRSPVEQIMRTSYALFVLLNSDSEHNRISLDRHHWGNKQIPVKNLIVMINEKPKEQFKYVKVLTLNELIGYIKYFDPIFSDAEVKSIADYLRVREPLGSWQSPF